MASIQTERLRELIETGREKEFYWWTEWARKREEVLAMDMHQCKICQARGRYRKAEIVHHVKHLKDRPDLALNTFDPETSQRQLISVCKQCHEELHPESLRHPVPLGAPLTQERWD